MRLMRLMRLIRLAAGSCVLAALLAGPGAAQLSSFKERAPKKSEEPLARPEAFQSGERIIGWIARYRLEPNAKMLPEAVRAMSRLGLLKEREQSGVFVGFMAGVLGDNGKDAKGLVAKFFPLPQDEQIAIVHAIAYSGLPDWRQLLTDFVERMPAQKIAIEKALYGKGNGLNDVPLDSGPAVLDMLWGYYLATGKHDPIIRLMAALEWSGEQKNVDRVTAAGMAKWTLASNASRDKELLNLYYGQLSRQPKAVSGPLKEVIKAAETHDIGPIRKAALRSVEEARVRKVGEVSPWVSVSQAVPTVIGLACVTASALGQAEIGIPCVVGGALSQAVANLVKGQR